LVYGGAGTVVAMRMIKDSRHVDREVAVAREIEALRTALAKHERVSGSDMTARLLRHVISERRRFFSAFSSPAHLF
jgi:hypothetical protein